MFSPSFRLVLLNVSPARNSPGVGHVVFFPIRLPDELGCSDPHDVSPKHVVDAAMKSAGLRVISPPSHRPPFEALAQATVFYHSLYQYTKC